MNHSKAYIYLWHFNASLSTKIRYEKMNDP